MKANYYRNSFKFKSDLALFFKRYRLIIILLSCAFVLGLITGIFTASNYSGDLTLDNIPDGELVAFLSGEKGSFGVFFSYAIWFVIALLLIIFCNFNKFCAFVNFVYILVRGYILGFTVFSIIALFSLAGIINVIIIVPFWLAINFLVILISSICISKNKVIQTFGRHCYANNNPRDFLVLLNILLFSILFLLCMIMPIIRITIIVN